MMKYLILLLGFAMAFSACGNRNTLKKELSDFKVEDTAAIDKIFLADKNNHTVLLQRDGKKWTANGDFIARNDLIVNLLTTIKRLEVKQFVPKPAIENTITDLAVHATKVEIYQGGKLSKTFYVGGPTMDMNGTYMLMEGSSVPFICYVPGFRGFLSNHFIPLIDEWKSRQIFAYSIAEIASASVEFKREPQASWEIVNVDNKSFKVNDLYNKRELAGFDTGRVKDVLKLFKVIGFEMFVYVDAGRMDSIRRNYALYTVSVKERSGKLRKVDLYQIPLMPGSVNMLGEPVSIDMDRMYGVIDGKTLTICQYFTFDPLTVPLSYFMREEQVNAP